MNERERVQQRANELLDNAQLLSFNNAVACIGDLLTEIVELEAECARLRSALEDIAHPDWNSAMEQSELIKRIVTLARAALAVKAIS